MKRILFVDDEPRILEGLQRTLRPQRKLWEMAFANGGREALTALESEPFDVVVTDMRMPGMDGADLLAAVRDRFPAVVRIVLSGYFDTETAMRAVPVAHQFLVKPCDAVKLRQAIERLGDYKTVLRNEAARRIINSIGELPALPETSARLMDAVQSPDVPIEQIAAIVEHDIGITAKVLQLVNSAFFGLSHEVAAVAPAVSYLGLDLLRQLVLTVEIFRTFQPSNRVAGFSLDLLQKHSRNSAKIAARLPLPKASQKSAVMASLLHDVGKLVLAAKFPGDFAAALKASHEHGCPFHVAEQEAFGATHAEIGAYLLGLWGLPASIVSPVCNHHAPAVSPIPPGAGLDPVAAVHVADMLDHEAAAEPLAEAGFDNGELDLEHLEFLGVATELEDWRAMAKRITATEGDDDLCQTP